MPRHGDLLASNYQYQCLFAARRILEDAVRQIWHGDYDSESESDLAWETAIDAKTHIELQMEVMRGIRKEAIG